MLQWLAQKPDDFLIYTPKPLQLILALCPSGQETEINLHVSCFTHTNAAEIVLVGWQDDAQT